MYIYTSLILQRAKGNTPEWLQTFIQISNAWMAACKVKQAWNIWTYVWNENQQFFGCILRRNVEQFFSPFHIGIYSALNIFSLKLRANIVRHIRLTTEPELIARCLI